MQVYLATAVDIGLFQEEKLNEQLDTLLYQGGIYATLDAAIKALVEDVAVQTEDWTPEEKETLIWDWKEEVLQLSEGRTMRTWKANLEALDSIFLIREETVRGL